MKNISPMRLLMTLAVAILLLLSLLLGILLTDTLLNIRQNLEQAPSWVFYAVLSALGLFSLFSGWLVIRLLKPKKSSPKAEPVAADASSVMHKLQQSKTAGINTLQAEKELAKLQQRKSAGSIHIALFGEISSGKSSLIKALLPDAEVSISATGGTTQEIKEYTWSSTAGDQLILSDMPGLNEAHGTRDPLARHEALRAHIVIYLVDGDLTRTQSDELKTLFQLNKPLILALNKTDQISADDKQKIIDQLQQQIAPWGKASVVAISTGAVQTAIRITADGKEEAIQRTLTPELQPLQNTLQKILDESSTVLEALRDSSVFTLVSQHLDIALAEQRNQQALDLTQSYAKKAVVASIATITPGTDILIQGYLATQMVKALAALYEIPVRKMDVDLLLELIQKHVRTHVTLLLAVAGNALKAFPGAGTLAGGALHAVAYGFLFESLGKSIAQSLQSRGELHPLQIADQFEDSLGENFTASAGRYTQLAFKALSKKD